MGKARSRRARRATNPEKAIAPVGGGLRFTNPTGRVLDVLVQTPEGKSELWSWTWHHTLVAPAWAREQLVSAGLVFEGAA